MGQNVVLYRVGSVDPNTKKAQRFPLASFNPADELLPVKLMHKASQEFSDCEKLGIPHSVLQVVLETRKADEQGKLSFVEFVPLFLTTGEPKGAPVTELSELDPKE